ncbi:MAG: ice-binding family protein, partial [bacterium]|nr:ice-binding family protein [bacterium]
MKKISIKSLVTASAIAIAFGFAGPFAAFAATAPTLGTADDFAVLAGSAISDPTGGSAIVGNVGLSPTGGTAITNLSCSETTGTIYDTNAGYTGGDDSTVGCLLTNAGLLIIAKNDLVTAFIDARDQATTTVITSDLATFNGGTLTPGVYGGDSSVGLTGAVTLDGLGDANAVFIIKSGSTLTTAGGSVVNLTTGTQACNVFWQVGSSATIGSGSNFKGTIMAAASISDAGGSTILGRLLARTAAVTLNNTDVTKPTCVAAAVAQQSS